MTIRKIGNSWYSDFYSKGKRVRKKLSSNKATAQRIYDTIIKQRDLSTFGIYDNDYEIKQLQKQFLLETSSRIGQRTLADYTSILENVTNFIGNMPLDLVRNKFNEYIKQRQDLGLSARSLNLIIELTRRMFRHGMETNQIAVNPLSGIGKIKGAKKLKRALKPREIKSLLENSGKYRIVWLVFLSTGMRKSELSKLKWKNVDLENGIINVVKDNPGKGIGTIPMTEEIIKELKLLKNRDKEKYVFTTKENTPVGFMLPKTFKSCLKKAGINQDGITLHSLRYTFATTLASQNRHPKHIQTLMRHRSIKTSMDIYTDVYKKDITAIIKDLKFM